MKLSSFLKQIVVGVFILSAGMKLSVAGISLDRTRLIFEEGNQSASANLTNTSKDVPFLAQSWVEDATGKKITSPLLVLPALQRINGSEKGVIRVTRTTGIDTLPQDRESLFYLNVREIPPKSTIANILMLSMQSRIKLFYRPVAIIPKIKGSVWQDRIVFHKKRDKLIAENPTPYYITLISLKKMISPKEDEKLTSFSGVMIAPKSSLDIPVTDSSVNGFKMMYVNDYGGHPEIVFSCDISLCKASSADQKSR